MGWFGPSRDEVWRLLSDEIGADFAEGGFWKGSRVDAHVPPWTITLDTYNKSEGKHSHPYTRMRVPYLNPDGFRFKIYRKGPFTELGKLFGMQDIEVGDPDFDEAFVIQGNDEAKVKELLSSKSLRVHLSLQPRLHFQVKDDEGWFKPRFPEGVDELSFEIRGTLKDLDRLKNLFDLFVETLDQLCKIGAASKVDPGFTL
ncbi:DUF3137 domain-containing protein [Singulisphaera sp. PoT]|uniref:DUF3137 domain-containing protein n=1 Tax=Singulisphaera sp. PoT TaxID=3411797 RepID=UPI003BF4B6BF